MHRIIIVLGYNDHYYMITSLQKKYIGAGIFFLLVAFLYFRAEPNTVALTVRTFQEKSDTYDVSISYPQFSDVKKSFNKSIQKTVEDARAEFVKSSEDTEIVRNTPSGKGMPEYVYTFMTSWNPDEISSRRISFVLHTSYFTGGAHGGQDMYTFNYDLEKKKDISLDDIFGTVPNYLNRISEFALSSLRSSLASQMGDGKPDETMLISGTAPTIDNYKRFTLGSGETITFYFPQYQVAPYAAGEQTVTMPLSYIIANK